MRVTLLGHASLLVEVEGANCLMDPVFFDPFEDGAVVSCPKRIVYPEKLPPIDILIISHRHPDHFDIRSLAALPRNCVAICPNDPLIVYALGRLGFKRVQPVHPMGEISSAGFELFPTSSEVTSVREFGMVFKDRSGVFFNQVDTELSPSTISAVLARFGRVDLLFAMYASQNFDFFDSQRAGFPFETHRRNLENVLRIQPRVAVPASAGFRFADDHGWLNHFLFPISRETFVEDLRRLDPTLTARIMEPGDVLEVAEGTVRHLSGASEAARTEGDDTSLMEYDPGAPVPDLSDPNPHGYSDQKLSEVTESFIVQGLAGFALSPAASSDPVASLYRRYGLHYLVTVVFPDRNSRHYCFDFSRREPVLTVTAGQVKAAEVVHRIAASALVGWIERRKSFFYVRAYSRRHARVYRLRYEKPRVRIEPFEPPDLLMHYLLNVAPGSEAAARQHVDLEIDALKYARA